MGEKKLKSPDMGVKGGLNFMLNFDHFLTSPQKDIPVKMILHQPRRIPNFGEGKSKEILLFPGNDIIIKIKPTVVDTTRNFNQMRFIDRQCILEENLNRDHNDTIYSQSNCEIETLINDVKDYCNCLPWYINKTSSKACDITGMECYMKFMQDHSGIFEKCKESCKMIKYASTLEQVTKIKNSVLPIFGHDVEKYFKEDFAKFLTHLHYDHSTFLSRRLSKVSFVHINFDDPEALVITKDAKVTLADKVGNIGGTMGLFLGFSFFGFMTQFLEFANWLLGKCRKLSDKR